MVLRKTKYFILSVILLFIAGCGVKETSVKKIPVEEFFKNPDVSGFQISPSGKLISFLKPYQNRMNIFVKDVRKTEEKRLTDSKDYDISKYFWVNENIIVYLKDVNGNEKYHLYRVKLNSGEIKDLTPFEGTTIRRIHKLKSQANKLLVELNKRNNKIFDLYKIDVESGKIELYEKNTNSITSRFFDENDNIKLALSTDGVNSVLLKKEKKGYKEILQTNFKEEILPVGFIDENRFYALSNLNRDKLALVIYNSEKKAEEKEVYSNKFVDLHRVFYSQKEKKLLGLSYYSWKLEYVWFDQYYKTLDKLFREKASKGNYYIVSKDDSETKFIIKVSSDVNPGTYFYYDYKKREFIKLADAYPNINTNDLSGTNPVSYRSFDNRLINAYLTIPKGKKSENLPVVVLPHGGPWLRDKWDYNKTVQFLANRGYAVLQTNYRGSTGYGKKFWEAGFKQWGSGMQDDIASGVKWLIKQGIADENRIAIYGYSFGGYSALMNIIRYPSLYKCAIDYSGITDIKTFLASVPPYWESFKKMIYEMVGNPETDKELIENHSPINFVDKIKTPLLIAAGKNDPRVDFSQVEDFIDLLKKENKNFRVIIKDNEGHSFRKEENKLELYNEIEKFLKKHLR